MKKINVNNERTSVEINGVKYDVRQSDGDVYHAGRKILFQCLNLRADDSGTILAALRDICVVIDDALGAGAMKKIVGDTPVTFPLALKILNVILSECGAKYADYINAEYLGAKE